MKNPPLDFKKLDFSRPNIAPWLSLPKDLWSLILKDFKTWRKMRVVCKYFANLIDPIFCMRIILNDGHVLNCGELFCLDCSLFCSIHFENIIRMERYNILKQSWRWTINDKLFNRRKFQKQKEIYNGFRFKILESKPKIPQVQKYFEIIQPYHKMKVKTKDEYDPSRKSNHKKKKFRKSDRRLDFIEMEYNQI